MIDSVTMREVLQAEMDYCYHTLQMDEVFSYYFVQRKRLPEVVKKLRVEVEKIEQLTEIPEPYSILTTHLFAANWEDLLTAHTRNEAEFTKDAAQTMWYINRLLPTHEHFHSADLHLPVKLNKIQYKCEIAKLCQSPDVPGMCKVPEIVNAELTDFLKTMSKSSLIKFGKLAAFGNAIAYNNTRDTILYRAYIKGFELRSQPSLLKTLSDSDILLVKKAEAILESTKEMIKTIEENMKLFRNTFVEKLFDIDLNDYLDD